TVVKSDGELTYFASDIAYHRNKYERGFKKLINVWGADHHGYVARLKAALRGLGCDPEALRVVLVQMVQLTRGGEPVRMGKRSGEFVALEDVLAEVGRGAVLFSHAQVRQPSRLRPGAGQAPVERQPGVLRAVRPRARVEYFRAGG